METITEFKQTKRQNNPGQCRIRCACIFCNCKLFPRRSTTWLSNCGERLDQRFLLQGQLSAQTPSTGLRHPSFLPSTTAVFSYAIGSRKLSANEQFVVGAQTVVSLLQTTQITSDVCFTTDHVAYANSNKTKIVWIEGNSFFLFSFPGVDASHVYVGDWALDCLYSHISTQTFRRALTASADSCTEIKSASSVA